MHSFECHSCTAAGKYARPCFEIILSLLLTEIPQALPWDNLKPELSATSALFWVSLLYCCRKYLRPCSEIILSVMLHAYRQWQWSHLLALLLPEMSFHYIMMHLVTPPVSSLVFVCVFRHCLSQYNHIQFVGTMHWLALLVCLLEVAIMFTCHRLPYWFELPKPLLSIHARPESLGICQTAVNAYSKL